MGFENIHSTNEMIDRRQQFSPTPENDGYSLRGKPLRQASLDEVRNMAGDQIVFYGDPVGGWLTAEKAEFLETELNSLTPKANNSIWVFAAEEAKGETGSDVDTTE